MPKGIIIFFSSYKVMDHYYEEWKKSNLLRQISRVKEVCKEYKNQRQFKASFAKYLSSYDSPGAIFMAVCNGKLSEGIDFTDEMARMVVVVGVPFPNIKDSYVRLKQEYLDRMQR